MENIPDWKLALPHYLGCALWSSQDDDGENLDAYLNPDDFDSESLKRAEQDLQYFFESYANIIAESGAGYEKTAYDLWLTRNRHGTGFWDRGYPAHVGKALTEAAHAMGELSVWCDGETMTAKFQ